jgi:hypothetical protein
MSVPIIAVGILALVALFTIRIAKEHERGGVFRFPISIEVIRPLLAASVPIEAVSARGNGPVPATARQELGAFSRTLTNGQPPHLVQNATDPLRRTGPGKAVLALTVRSIGRKEV